MKDRVHRSEQCDLRSQHGSNARRWMKRRLNRLERRHARRFPDCTPGYGFYRGWVS